MQALIEGDVCAELPPEDDKERDRSLWDLGKSSRLLGGGTSSSTTDTNGGGSGSGGYAVDEAAFPPPSSTLLRDINNDPAFPTAKPAVAAAAPLPTPPPTPPQAFGGYDGGARRPSGKVERKRVTSAAALPSSASASGSASASAAASAVTSRQQPPRATPTTTAVRKGSLTLDVDRLASAASASTSPLASTSSKGAVLPAGEAKQQRSESAAGAGAKMVAARRPSERWRALGILKESWTKLERTRLLFPALLPPAEPPQRRLPLGLGSKTSVDYDDETYLCGRRAACRSPLLLPGLFHMLQARLANR